MSCSYHPNSSYNCSQRFNQCAACPYKSSTGGPPPPAAPSGGGGNGCGSIVGVGLVFAMFAGIFGGGDDDSHYPAPATSPEPVSLSTPPKKRILPFTKNLHSRIDEMAVYDLKHTGHYNESIFYEDPAVVVWKDDVNSMYVYHTGMKADIDCFYSENEQRQMVLNVRGNDGKRYTILGNYKYLKGMEWELKWPDRPMVANYMVQVSGVDLSAIDITLARHDGYKVVEQKEPYGDYQCSFE